MNKTCKVSVLANGSLIASLPSAALPAEEETWNFLGSFVCEEVRFKSLLRLLQSAVSWLAFKVFFNLYLLWFSPQICCFVCWISHPWPNMQSKKMEDRDQNLTLRQSSRRFAVCPMCTHRVVDSFETSGMKYDEIVLCFCFHLSLLCCWMRWVYQKHGERFSNTSSCVSKIIASIITSITSHPKILHNSWNKTAISKIPCILWCQWWGLKPGSVARMADCVVLQGRRKSNHLQAWLAKLYWSFQWRRYR